MEIPLLTALYYYIGYCNLNCRHCWITPRHIRSKSNVKGIGKNKFKSIIDNLKPLGLSTVKLCGGEPLLLENINEIVGIIKDESLDLWIESNGILITKGLLGCCNIEKSYFSISLDGPTAKIHSIIRRDPTCFKKTIENIKLLKEYDCKFQIIFSIHRRNIRYFERMVELTKELGASNLKVNVISPCGSAESEDFEKDYLSPFEVTNFYNDKIEYLKAIDFPVFFDIPPVVKPLSQIYKLDCRCSIKNILSIFHNGNISICGIGDIHKSLVLGNVYNHNPRDIWFRSPILRKIREDLPTKLGGVCSNCILKSLCLGKCIAQTYHKLQEISAGYYFCEELSQMGTFPIERRIDGKRMKINSNIVFRKEIDGGILFDYTTGDSKIINLTAAQILDMLEKGFEKEEIVQEMTKEYGIDKNKFELEYQSFVQDLINEDIIGEI